MVDAFAMSRQCGPARSSADEMRWAASSSRRCAAGVTLAERELRWWPTDRTTAILLDGLRAHTNAQPLPGDPPRDLLA